MRFLVLPSRNKCQSYRDESGKRIRVFVLEKESLYEEISLHIYIYVKKLISLRERCVQHPHGDSNFAINRRIILLSNCAFKISHSEYKP